MTPQIAFHFNVPDRLGYACRLVRKAWMAGHRVVVAAETDVLRELDVLLWTHSQLEFIPHCLESAAPAMLAVSPVVLQSQVVQAPHRQVMVNLHPEVMPGFEQFERLIEVVPVDDTLKLAARQRWRHYVQQGYRIEQFDLSAKREAARSED